MKLFNKIFCLFFIAVSLSILSCRSAENSITNSENKTANESSDLTNEPSKAVENSSLKINEEGYELPDLSKYKLTTKLKKADIKAPKTVLMNIYSPKNEDFLLNTNSGEKVKVLTIKEFEIENRKFCYIISVAPSPGVTYMTNLIYYDLDSDGKFETQDGKFSDFPTMFPK